MKQEWNDRDKGKPKYWKKTSPSATRFTTDPTRTGLGTNPGLHGDKPVSNRLSHDSDRHGRSMVSAIYTEIISYKMQHSVTNLLLPLDGVTFIFT